MLSGTTIGEDDTNVLFGPAVPLFTANICCCSCCFGLEPLAAATGFCDGVPTNDTGAGVVVVVDILACTPVTFTLEYEVKEGLFTHSYLAVILFGPGLIVVYLDVSTKFHFE